jgi:hypothetical protein
VAFTLLPNIGAPISAPGGPATGGSVGDTRATGPVTNFAVGRGAAASSLPSWVWIAAAALLGALVLVFVLRRGD